MNYFDHYTRHNALIKTIRGEGAIGGKRQDVNRDTIQVVQ